MGEGGQHRAQLRHHAVLQLAAAEVEVPQREVTAQTGQQRPRVVTAQRQPQAQRVSARHRAQLLRDVLEAGLAKITTGVTILLGGGFALPMEDVSSNAFEVCYYEPKRVPRVQRRAVLRPELQDGLGAEAAAVASCGLLRQPLHGELRVRHRDQEGLGGHGHLDTGDGGRGGGARHAGGCGCGGQLRQQRAGGPAPGQKRRDLRLL